MIKIWQSFACNNSSSYRLIALFETPERAAEVTAELREFLPRHAAQVDATLIDDDRIPSQAQLELAARYGFTTDHLLYWGMGGLVGDEPILVHEDTVVVVQHWRCGGFRELVGYFEARGAATDHRSGARVELSVLFRHDGDPAFAPLLDQIASPELVPPWEIVHPEQGPHAGFCDASTAGLFLPLNVHDIASMKAWFTERGIAPAIRIGDATDLAVFQRIAMARCSACGGRLEYLDPRLHDIETPQLACKPCGGLYDLSAFP